MKGVLAPPVRALRAGTASPASGEAKGEAERAGHRVDRAHAHRPHRDGGDRDRRIAGVRAASRHPGRHRRGSSGRSRQDAADRQLRQRRAGRDRDLRDQPPPLLRASLHRLRDARGKPVDRYMHIFGWHRAHRRREGDRSPGQPVHAHGHPEPSTAVRAGADERLEPDPWRRGPGQREQPPLHTDGGSTRPGRLRRRGRRGDHDQRHGDPGPHRRPGEQRGRLRDGWHRACGRRHLRQLPVHGAGVGDELVLSERRVGSLFVSGCRRRHALRLPPTRSRLPGAELARRQRQLFRQRGGSGGNLFLACLGQRQPLLVLEWWRLHVSGRCGQRRRPGEQRVETTGRAQRLEQHLARGQPVLGRRWGAHLRRGFSAHQAVRPARHSDRHLVVRRHLAAHRHLQRRQLHARERAFHVRPDQPEQPLRQRPGRIQQRAGRDVVQHLRRPARKWMHRSLRAGRECSGQRVGEQQQPIPVSERQRQRLFAR